MKQYIVLTIIGILLLGIIENSNAWDSTAAKFYPLRVGNQWSYHYISRGGNPVPCYANNQYNYIVTIIGDTVINGHKYYKFTNGDRLRIDSTSMNVYKYLGAGECLIDSLLAKKNSQVNSCELWGVVSDTNMVNFAGENRRTFNISGIGYTKRLMYGIGIFYHGGCELNSGFDKQLNGCIINGVPYGVMLGLNNISYETPDKFSLSQNYPNPFNPTTSFGFRIAEFGLVRLTVFDVLGKEVQTLVNKELQPGSYEADWDASAYPSGVYYYKLESGSYSETKKMVLIK